MRNIIMILIGSAILLGCGGDGKITQTGEEFLAEMSRESCEVAAECGLLDRTVDQCVSFIVDTFCVQLPGQCSVDYTVPAAEYNRCLDAWRDRTCPAVAAGGIPGECLVSELNQISIFY